MNPAALLLLDFSCVAPLSVRYIAQQLFHAKKMETQSKTSLCVFAPLRSLCEILCKQITLVS